MGTQVKTFKADKDEFYELPNFVFNHLRALKILRLSNNHIHIIKPSAFYGLNNLTELDLSNNEIKNICPVFSTSKFPRPVLTTLNLSKNKIKQLTDSCFVGTPNLRNLNLGENEINQISSNAFKSLKYLEILYMQDNNITELLDGTFDDLIHLKILDLRINSIKIISETIFIHLNNLEMINLASNEGIWMPPLAFMKNSNLKNLGLIEEMCNKTKPNGYFVIECKGNPDYQCKCSNEEGEVYEPELLPWTNWRFIKMTALILILFKIVVTSICLKTNWQMQGTPI